MNTFNHMIKIALFTLFIVRNEIHYTSASNGNNENGFGKAVGTRNIRCLSERSREFGRPDLRPQSEPGQYVNGDNPNEQKNRNGDGFGPESDQWNYGYYGPHGSDPQMHERVYRNTDASDYYTNGYSVRYVSPGNTFNNELFEKLKNNAIYIIPVLLAAFYVMRNMGTQSMLLLAAIIGVLMYTQRYVN
ncbi:hypothetical protein AK88_01376 [Plasmodium fragile]|uniref:Pv-fam-d protein n=1 Tax=Plasmodium fragile TaxID=5857 RepID=A0A0D9QQ10_PLAFR|nr:uncharacterized protein AK88_01376 [Plasmodium fragile]KJP88882.1 hypothetical protein AK88_01376 [Plasmodium fragile]